VNLPTGNWVILFFIQKFCTWRNLYQKELYIDVLSKKAVSKFIELTHEQYYKHHKEYFTNTIVGFYCDEPGMYTNLFRIDSNSIPWTDNLPQFFKQEKGYDLLPKLFSIWMDIPDTSDKVRYDYYDVISQMYRQNYFGQISSWCKNHNVKFSGHLLLEENLVDTIKTQGNFFEAIKLMDIPGVDIVKDIDESKSLTPKLASSIAHFKGKERSSCEIFGMFGWDLTFEKMKYVTNWLCVRGINMIIPHALYYSTEGERKNDCPPSLFFQNPIWERFKEYTNYVKRLCYLLSLGKHVSNIALYYPIVSGWTNIKPDNSIKVLKFDKSFKEIGNLLFKNQWDYDILDDNLINESFLSENGYLGFKKEGNKLKKEIKRSKSENYKVLFIPYSPTIPLNTLKKIYRFCEKGGLVIFPDGTPKNTLYRNNNDDDNYNNDDDYDIFCSNNSCNNDVIADNDNENGDVGCNEDCFGNDNKKEKNFLLLKEKLFKKSKFKNHGFFQNKINKGICFFRDEDVDKDIKNIDILNEDSISFEKNKEDLKSKKLSNFLKKSSLFNKLLKIKITRSFLQLIYKAYKTLNRIIEIRKNNLKELNLNKGFFKKFISSLRSRASSEEIATPPSVACNDNQDLCRMTGENNSNKLNLEYKEYENKLYEKLKRDRNILQLLNKIFKRKIWLSGDSQEVTMIQRDLDFCKILFLLNESNSSNSNCSSSKNEIKIFMNIQTIPLICNLENGELIKIKNFKWKNDITEVPITLNKEESTIFVLPLDGFNYSLIF